MIRHCTYGENPAIELKEIKGNRPCNSIIANAEIYVNAYLNSSLQETGKIFWGVASDRTITGVRLSYDEIDTIQRKISEVLSQAEPYVSPDLYNIKFNKIATASGAVQPDTYIVEVDVFPYPGDWLYATSKGEVFIKTPGGKRKLLIFRFRNKYCYGVPVPGGMLYIIFTATIPANESGFL